MKSLGAIAVLTVLGLGGCASWRSTDLTPIGSNSALTRSVKGFGLFLNVHTGFEWLSGEAYEKTTIQLHGTKDHYTETEFDIVDWDGKPIPYLQAKTGTVTLDRKAHTVIIAIYIDGKPFSLNGRHSYRDKDAWPAAVRCCNAWSSPLQWIRSRRALSPGGPSTYGQIPFAFSQKAQVARLVAAVG